MEEFAQTTTDYIQQNQRLNQAIIFAAQCHAGQLRKGTTLPYILHPLETMQILSVMQADTNLLIAGLLHDVLEDTHTTAEQITQQFGPEVLALVQEHSENKADSWLNRKLRAIQMLEQADLPQKMLALADKLSNLRSIARDYQTVGDELWERFHAPKEKQAWYYNGILNALAPLQDLEATAALYEELIEHYKDVFVIYKITPTYDKLYQANTFGEAYCLTKGNPQWQPTTYRFRQNDIPLTRQEAETLEDKWYDLFLTVVEQDLQDAVYPLYQTDKQQTQMQLVSGRLTCCSQTEATAPLCAVLNEDDTYECFTRLRMHYGITQPLQLLLTQCFGGAEARKSFQAFCDAAGVSCQFIQMTTP